MPTIPDKCTDVATCLKVVPRELCRSAHFAYPLLQVLANADCSIAPVFSEELHKGLFPVHTVVLIPALMHSHQSRGSLMYSTSYLSWSSEVKTIKTRGRRRWS